MIITKTLKYVKVGNIELIEQPSGAVRILFDDSRLGEFSTGTLQNLVGALTGLLTVSK